MQITIEKSAIAKTLSHLYRIVEKKSTIPVLSNIKVEAGKTLRLTATNVDLEIVEELEANVAKPGSTTIPAHVLYDIVRKLPEGDMEIKTSADGAQVVLRAGNSEFTLPSLPIDDFPLMASTSMPFKFTLANDDLVKLIDRTKFAVSTEETRYFLNGIYLHTLEKGKKELLRAVATDGHRLARQDIAMPADAKGMPAVIIPRKVVTELRALLEDTSADVTVEISETKARFTFGAATLTSKLIDGKFPDYEKVIPTSNDKKVEVDCKLFSEAVDRVSSVSYEKTKAIKLKLAKSKLTLFASTPDSGSAFEDLEIAYDETPLEIGFNSKYLLDIADQIEGKFMRFVISDAASPAIITELDDDSAVYVLMPMRI
ncbi:MAG: DNA polymerase III subunit beta [Rickettsiales bacterium]|jgi:DNA polymerase-3 subunit beta|nr:DNA polymerase III subunit beta [Rickettsiales bacterium]